jgi:hypothetical protein
MFRGRWVEPSFVRSPRTLTMKTEGARTPLVSPPLLQCPVEPFDKYGLSRLATGHFNVPLLYRANRFCLGNLAALTQLQ